jgi:RES domain-containing protein
MDDMFEAQAWGDRWLESKRTAVVKVPSTVTQSRENNLVLNVDYPQFALITVEPPECVHWDERFFGRHPAQSK